MKISNESFCMELSSNDGNFVRTEQQYEADVIESLLGEIHPSRFWLIGIGEGRKKKKEKLVWVDCFTHQIYWPETLKCATSSYLSIKEHPVEAKNKKRSPSSRVS